MIERYGFPPGPAECAEGVVPDYLPFKLTPRTVPSNLSSADELLGQPVSVAAIARQLNLHYEFTPTRVHVPDLGTFLLGPNGWSFTREDSWNDHHR